jgi:ribosomal protein L3 glutamine methyltransferase
LEDLEKMEEEFADSLMETVQDNNSKLKFLMTQFYSNQLNTIGDFVRFCVTELELTEASYGQGTYDAKSDARFLVYGFLRLDLNDDSYLPCKVLEGEKKDLFNLINIRTKKKIPVAYLLDFAFYDGLKFEVNENVIIPRSPIAFLFKNQTFIDYLNLAGEIDMLDLCCGSGAIGIAVTYHLLNSNFVETGIDDINLTLADISEEALALTELNGEKLLGMRPYTVRSNLFTKIKGQFDLIVCNPPYVDFEDYYYIAEEFRQEPKLALTGKGDNENGLHLVCKILAKAALHLKDNGILIMEVGNSQHNFPPQMRKAMTFIEQICDTRDIEGRPGIAGIFVFTKEELQAFQQRFAEELAELATR